MGSHQAEVRFPPLPQPKQVLDLALELATHEIQDWVDLCYVKADRLEIEPATCQSQVQRRTTAAPPRHIKHRILILRPNLLHSYLRTKVTMTTNLAPTWQKVMPFSSNLDLLNCQLQDLSDINKIRFLTVSLRTNWLFANINAISS